MELQTAVGDTIVIDTLHDAPARTGEILEVIGGGGEHHYRVRWQDSHASFFSPGSTRHAIHRSGR